MPELPEVEVARRNLSSWLDGKRIARAKVEATRIARGGSPRAIERMLDGKRVASVERRGKWLRILLDGGAILYSHLGMSGKWVARDASDGKLPHERARIDAARGRSVRYVDPRMFGRLVAAPGGEEIAEWAALGPDPLAGGLSPKALAARLTRRSGPIKAALLDQSLAAGVGNIQATEALWRAKIHPLRPANALAPAEARRLVDGIHASIEETLAKQSGPEITYVEEAGAENPFLVYDRAGQPCPRCRTKLTRIVVAGRGTVFCPRCQRR